MTGYKFINWSVRYNYSYIVDIYNNVDIYYTGDLNEMSISPIGM